MLHLPALTMTRKMGDINQAVAKLGLTIRGLYGEGSEAQGDLYQVSNQITLGRTEQEIVEAIQAVGNQVAELERKQRQALLERDAVGLEDVLMRSVGVFTHARRMDSKEFMERWSNVRVASALGMVNVSLTDLDALLYAAQPAGLIQKAGKDLTAQQRDQARADLIRASLRVIQ
jgi:protein arginine kinase